MLIYKKLWKQMQIMGINLNCSFLTHSHCAANLGALKYIEMMSLLQWKMRRLKKKTHLILRESLFQNYIKLGWKDTGCNSLKMLLRGKRNWLKLVLWCLMRERDWESMLTSWNSWVYKVYLCIFKKKMRDCIVYYLYCLCLDLIWFFVFVGGSCGELLVEVFLMVFKIIVI